MEDWKRIAECPDEGMCLQKVIPKCRFWGTDGSRKFLCHLEVGTAKVYSCGPDPLRPRIAHSASTTGALNWVQERCAKPT
jgi:hypothetical protein